ERWDEPPRCLSEAAMSQLAGYHYPGNVRELENILERAATLCDGDVIEAEDLQLPRGVESSNPGQHASRLSLEERLVHEERQVIQEALEAVGGDREQAAQRLGLSTRQLGFRLRRLGLESA
ncbi:MAG: sigma-54-dependent Fis family transcriptional regulator, partial [Chromatiaceae bacterium]